MTITIKTIMVGTQDEDESERLLMAYSPNLRAILDRSREQIREGQCLCEKELWAQFEEAPAAKEPVKPKK